MSRIAFVPVIIAAAVTAMLSLSVLWFGHAFAAEDDNSGDTKVTPGRHVPAHVNCQCAQTVKIPDKDDNNGASSDNSGRGGGPTHHRIRQINRLFRSDSIDNTGSSALDSIPVVQPLFNNNNTNTTSSITTATVTIPVCNGIVPGPCLDKTTGQIIP